jgi:hypothetical protein
MQACLLWAVRSDDILLNELKRSPVALLLHYFRIECFYTLYPCPFTGYSETSG